MTLTPAQAVAQVDSPRHDWDELSDHYKRHCREIAVAAIAAHKVLEADVPLAQPEYMPVPSFHAERDGTLGEVEVGDRFMWDGVWREVTSTYRPTSLRDGISVAVKHAETIHAETFIPVRIQKRATNTEGPPAEMRLPGGDVAYQTIRAGEVVPGMWVQVPGGDDWLQVEATHAHPYRIKVELTFCDAHAEWFSTEHKVRVASPIDGARLAAERKAMQAEAYDTACEART